MLQEHQNLIHGLDWLSARGVYIYNLQIYNLQLVTIRFLPSPAAAWGNPGLNQTAVRGRKVKGGPPPEVAPPQPSWHRRLLQVKPDSQTGSTCDMLGAWKDPNATKGNRIPCPTGAR